MSYTPPTNERGLYLPKRDGDEVDDMNNWPALDAMIEGAHPDVQLYSNVNPPPASGGTTVAPGTAMTSRATTNDDDGGRFTVTGTITIAPHASPVANFSVYFSGTGTLAFTESGGVSVDDCRTGVTLTGEQKYVAALVHMGDNKYDLTGTKPA